MAGGTSGQSSRMGVGGSAMMAAQSPENELASKGGRPVSSSWSSTPRAQRSVR
ncbi:MAG: hypothetical protein MUF64_03855 [Polyangiaceae bacterium]|nr:hypothetical protein [Polyangiaceae bacterium]